MTPARFLFFLLKLSDGADPFQDTFVCLFVCLSITAVGNSIRMCITAAPVQKKPAFKHKPGKVHGL